jgi:hypothetical protein
MLGERLTQKFRLSLERDALEPCRPPMYQVQEEVLCAGPPQGDTSRIPKKMTMQKRRDSDMEGSKI